MSKLSLIAVVAALGLGVAACGGSSSSSSSSSAPASSASSSSSAAAPAAGGSSSLAIAADPGGALKYTKKALAAKAGKVSIVMTNMSPEDHNLTIQKGTSGAVVGATPTFMGGSKTLDVNLKPGTYTFYCSVPGHRAAGMVGTLTVS